jgi:hypothetical protein
MSISVKKRAALTVSKLFISIVESKGEVHLPVSDAVAPLVC